MVVASLPVAVLQSEYVYAHVGSGVTGWSATISKLQVEVVAPLVSPSIIDQSVISPYGVVLFLTVE